MGISTNVSENNSSVEACVNITHGSVERSAFAYISTSESTDPELNFTAATGNYTI